MDFSLEHHASFIGAEVSELPTPSLVVSKPTIERNIAQLHRDVEAVGVGFRPHVKTLKVSPSPSRAVTPTLLFATS